MHACMAGGIWTGSEDDMASRSSKFTSSSLPLSASAPSMEEGKPGSLCVLKTTTKRNRMRSRKDENKGSRKQNAR